MKLFHKIKSPDWRRDVYFLNMKIFSYKRKPTYKNDFAEIARNMGVKVGENVQFISLPAFGSEPYFIEIGNDTVISFDVTFLNHDGAVHACRPYVKNPDDLRKTGRIKIGDWCFIGCKTVILPNVTIGNHCVTGACSVVTKSIPDGEVWAGNPAKFICKTEDFAKKIEAGSNSAEQLELFSIMSKIRGYGN